MSVVRHRPAASRPRHGSSEPKRLLVSRLRAAITRPWPRAFVLLPLLATPSLGSDTSEYCDELRKAPPAPITLMIPPGCGGLDRAYVNTISTDLKKMRLRIFMNGDRLYLVDIESAKPDKTRYRIETTFRDENGELSATSKITGYTATVVLPQAKGGPIRAVFESEDEPEWLLVYGSSDNYKIHVTRDAEGLKVSEVTPSVLRSRIWAPDLLPLYCGWFQFVAHLPGRHVRAIVSKNLLGILPEGSEIQTAFRGSRTRSGHIVEVADKTGWQGQIAGWRFGDDFSTIAVVEEVGPAWLRVRVMNGRTEEWAVRAERGETGWQFGKPFKPGDCRVK